MTGTASTASSGCHKSTSAFENEGHAHFIKVIMHLLANLWPSRLHIPSLSITAICKQTNTSAYTHIHTHAPNASFELIKSHPHTMPSITSLCVDKKTLAVAVEMCRSNVQSQSSTAVWECVTSQISEWLKVYMKIYMSFSDMKKKKQSWCGRDTHTFTLFKILAMRSP